MKRKTINWVLIFAALLLAAKYLFFAGYFGWKISAGTARLVTHRLNTEVFIDGKPEPGALCFQTSKGFSHQPVNKLILLLPSQSDATSCKVIIAEKYSMTVGFPPNCQPNENVLILNSYLLQTESGGIIIPFGSFKSESVDPELHWEEQMIEFSISNPPDRKPGPKVKIILHAPIN